MPIKYYLTYLKYYYYLFYEFFIFVFNIFLIYITFIHYPSFFYHKSLAFNVNILYSLKNTEESFNTEKIYLSQSSIQKVNNQQHDRANPYIYKFLRHYNYIILKKYLNEMKLSGFIFSVDCIKVLIKNQRYFKLYIQVNKIIKTIHIYDSNSLIISNVKLENILKKHLGLPKNYKKLHQSIQKIFLWYRIQGFSWINITIIDDDNNQNINMKIIEKKVISSKIICKNFHRTKKNIFILNAIKLEMKQMHGNILNKYELNTKIRMIQKKYLLQDISYKIINHQEGLSINLIYSIYNNKFLEIYYSPNILYCSYKSYKGSLIKYLMNFSKIYEMIIYKYTVKSIVNLKINIQYLYIINLKINLINKIFNKHIHSFHKKIYYHKQKKYDLNLFWFKYTFMYFKQKIFILHLLNFEIYNEYHLNQSFKFIQKINNIIYKYYRFLIEIQDNINYTKYLIVKYKKYIFSKIFYYKINLVNSYSYSYLENINHFKIKSKQYLFLYLNNYPNMNVNSIKSYSHLLNFYLNNKLHINIKSHLLNVEIQYNIVSRIIYKLIFLKILFMDSCNIDKNTFQQLLCIYVNYSFYINKYNQLYIFNNYVYDVNLRKNNYNSLFGIGLQGNLPFKQIPYIRLEYIVNLKNCFYLFMDKYSI